MLLVVCKMNLFIAKVTKNVDFTNATNRHYFDFFKMGTSINLSYFY